MDVYAISNALAARFKAVTAPTGQSAIRAAYGQVPQGIAALPCVVVFPRSGTQELNASRLFSTIEFDVLFLVSKSPGDAARIEATRQKWLAPLLAALDGQIQLGLPYVVKAWPTAWEFAEITYGGDPYDGIRLTVRVDTHDNRTFSA